MREFEDTNGVLWSVELISHGRTSEYLHRRVHRPLLQFTCLGARRPRRYVGWAGVGDDGLAEVPDTELQVLLERARPH